MRGGRRRRLGRDEEREHGRARRPQLRDVGGLRSDDPDRRGGDPEPQAGDQLSRLLAAVREHADARAGLQACEVAPEDPALGPVARPEADRPRVAGRVAAEGRGGRSDEELRHPRRVEEVARGEPLRGAEGVDDREDAVPLDELAGRLERPIRIGCVVGKDVVDPAAVHAAAGVDEAEVRLGAARHRGRAGIRPRQRHGRAEQDSGRRDTGLRGHDRPAPACACAAGSETTSATAAAPQARRAFPCIGRDSFGRPSGTGREPYSRPPTPTGSGRRRP